MERKDVRLAFTELRSRTGLSIDGFAELLGYGSGSALACYEHLSGSYQCAHLPDHLIDRMLVNLVGEGHPAVSRDDIIQLSLAQDAPPRDLSAELVTPSLLADILVAFDGAVENIDQLRPMASVSAKALYTSKLFKQLTSSAITSAKIGTIMSHVNGGETNRPLNMAEREAALEELVAQTMLVELIEQTVHAGGVAAYLGHLLQTRYDGVPLQHQNSASLCAILDEISALSDAHQNAGVAESDNVVVLRNYRT